MEKTLEIVTVLLATYNGEEFLGAQLESLASQEGVILEVHANDDGSTDRTLDILNQWQRTGLITSISSTNRIGATRAFLFLLGKCTTSDFVVFCDQDDIWDSRKIVSMLPFAKSEEPRLVVCAREFIDEDGKKIVYSESKPLTTSFAYALVENIAPGNCSLINSSTIRLLNSYENPPVAHYDSWIYLNVAAYGQCILIAEKLVKYRIHKGNLVGIRNYRFRSKLKSIDEYFLQNKYFREHQRFDLTPINRAVLDEFTDLFSQKSAFCTLLSIMKFSVKRQKKRDSFAFTFLLVWLYIEKRSGLRK